jgi:uncharacterized protein
VLGTVAGNPISADQVLEPSDDRWSHSLFNLASTLPAGQRYSYVFNGSAQVLDHVLVNAPMLARLTRFAYARVNSDFPEASSADPTIPDRFSDHDGPVAYFTPGAKLTTTTDVPAVVVTGSSFTYQAAVTNAGPDAAGAIVVTNVLPHNTEFGSVLAPDGWTCQAAAGELRCEAASLAPGATASFLISMTAVCATADGAGFASSTTAASPTEHASERADNGSADSGVFANPAPVITNAQVDTATIPADGKLHLVRVSYSVADNCGPLRNRLFVQSNESPKGKGDSTLSEDWEVVDKHSVLLRGEQSGEAKRGRVYTILITSKDSVRNVTVESVIVTVDRQSP